MTYLQPTPDGPAPCQPAAHSQAKRRRGCFRTGAHAARPMSTGSWQGTARGHPGKQSPACCPATVPSARRWPSGARADVGLQVSTLSSQGPLPLAGSAAYTHTHTHTIMHMHIQTHTTHTHTCLLMHSHTHTCNYTNTHTLMHTHNTFTCAHTHAHSQIYAHLCPHTFMPAIIDRHT